MKSLYLLAVLVLAFGIFGCSTQQQAPTGPIKTYECPDGSVVKNLSECQKTYICPDGTSVMDLSKCPTYTCPDNTTVTDISKCKKCPESCDDGNLCTRDYCETTSLECKHEVLNGTTCGTGMTCYVGFCTKDKCINLYNSEKMSKDEIEKEVGACYTSKYVSMAVQKNNTDVCDEIMDPYYLSNCYLGVAFIRNNYFICGTMREISYEAKGYYDQVTNKDVCYSNYVTYSVNNNLIFDEDACNRITNSQMKESCLQLKNYIFPPTGIKTLYASKQGNVLAAYFILQNEKGSTSTADGTATISIIEKTGYGIYETQTTSCTKTFTVKKQDYSRTTLGLGSFEHEDIIYNFGSLSLSGCPLDSSKTPYLKLKFVTSDGKIFEEETAFY